MNIKAYLENNLLDILTEYPELFLVGDEHREDKGHFVFILDGDEGVSIGQCGKISRRLMRLIEENPEVDALRESFSFEIASPGAEAPLKLLRQYPKHLGREFEVELEDGAKFFARLEATKESELEFKELIKSKVKGRRDKEGETKNIPFEQIKESKIKLSFK